MGLRRAVMARSLSVPTAALTSADIEGARVDEVVLLVETSSGWQVPVDAGYAGEAELQGLLARNPHLIPGLTAPAVAVRELRTTAGPVDVVIVDSAGVIPIVECKRDSNSQSRREILGQVLDYAGRLWQMDEQAFTSLWSSKHESGTGPADLLALDDTARAALADALANGRFRLVLALDALNDDLCRLVDFVNQHTADSLTLFAMEFRHWRHGTTRLLVPRAYGVEAAAAKERRADSSSHPNWTEQTAFAWLQENAPDRSADLRAFLDATADYPELELLWTASQTPSLVIALTRGDATLFPYRLEVGKGPSGRIEIVFNWTVNASAAGRDDSPELPPVTLATTQSTVSRLSTWYSEAPAPGIPG